MLSDGSSNPPPAFARCVHGEGDVDVPSGFGRGFPAPVYVRAFVSERDFFYFVSDSLAVSIFSASAEKTKVCAHTCKIRSKRVSAGVAERTSARENVKARARARERDSARA